MHITTNTAQVVICEQIKIYFNCLRLFNQAFIFFTKQSDIYLAQIYLCTVNIGPVITFYMECLEVSNVLPLLSVV